MTQLGNFRDDFYNALNVLTQAQAKATVQNGGVLAAALLGGATDCYLNVSGQAGAQALTTDSAANIIAQIQNAVAQAQAAAATFPSLLSGAQGSPPTGVPNLFNLSYTLTISNFNTAAGAITLTGGAGVTIVGTNTLAISTQRQFVVTITSANAVTMTSLYGATITAA